MNDGKFSLSVIALTLLNVVPAMAQTTGGSDDRTPLDADGDRMVSQDEFLAARLARAERRFNRLDRDDDGQITETDLADRPEPPDVDRDALRACIEDTLGVELPEPPEPGSRFDAIDVNGDGVITLEEALTSAEDRAVERFMNLDENADGQLERSEVRRPLRRAARLRQARRQCLREQQEANDLLGG
ncbi:MAG: hypothetical protein AAF736_09865 [Pseudomonadota bacterium]